MSSPIGGMGGASFQSINPNDYEVRVKATKFGHDISIIPKNQNSNSSGIGALINKIKEFFNSFSRVKTDSEFKSQVLQKFYQLRDTGSQKEDDSLAAKAADKLYKTLFPNVSVKQHIAQLNKGVSELEVKIQESMQENEEKISDLRKNIELKEWQLSMLEQEKSTGNDEAIKTLKDEIQDLEQNISDLNLNVYDLERQKELKEWQASILENQPDDTTGIELPVNRKSAKETAKNLADYSKITDDIWNDDSEDIDAVNDFNK
jgi:vacuolar-type H+-ATPase subunit I/STV1